MPVSMYDTSECYTDCDMLQLSDWKKDYFFELSVVTVLLLIFLFGKMSCLFFKPSCMTVSIVNSKEMSDRKAATVHSNLVQVEYAYPC
jgi:hypothetical protein